MNARDTASAPPSQPGPEPQTGPEPEGGEAACLLNRVCDECGRLADTAPPTTCPRCGAPIGG